MILTRNLSLASRIQVFSVLTFVILGMLWLTANIAHASTYTYIPTDDAFTLTTINVTDSGVNDTYLKIQDGSSTRRAFLQFDASDLNGTVSSVTLKLTNRTNYGTPELRVYEGSHNNWTEDTLDGTNNNVPSTGTLWGSYDSAIAENEQVSIDLGTSISSSGVYTLIIEALQSDDAWFNSKDYGSGAPVLEIVTSGDTKAPNTITDLSAESTTYADKIDLSWTAPADDSSPYYASSYDVRYSTSPITEANWASATQASGEPTPAGAGLTENMTISGLSANTTYYFAVKSSDGASNVSGLSNVPFETSFANGTKFNPSEDVFIANSSVINNSYIKIQNSATTRVGYLKFDVSGLSGTVTNVFLHLTNTSVTGTPEVRVYEGTDTSWTEGTITSANAPSEGSLLASYDNALTNPDSIRLDLGTSLVDGNGTYTLILKANKTNGDEAWFNSSEAASNLPELEIVTDSTAPAALSGMTATTKSNGSVNLSWTAPGDDGSIGTASKYEVRYSTSTITAANWDQADRAVGEPIPLLAGSTQAFRVNGLSPSTAYYFALKTIDDVGNASSLSNIPSATTSAVGITTAACDFTIPNDTRDFYKGDGTAGFISEVQPGDVVCIEGGTRSTDIVLRDFHGTEQDPITFINVDGQVVIDSPNQTAISIGRSSYFRFTGTGDSSYTYGFKLSTTNNNSRVFHVMLNSTNYELDHINLEEDQVSYSGFALQTAATCDLSANRGNFTQYDTIVRDNKINNTRGEGIYLGSSHYYSGEWKDCDGDSSNGNETQVWVHAIEGVRVYNNIISNTGRDGIQIGSATQDVEVYNNSVTTYGIENAAPHLNGLQINPGTTGRWFNNYIDIGTSAYGQAGIENQGRGDMMVFNNVIIEPNRFGILGMKRMNSTDPVFDKSPIHYFNNTIINPGEQGIDLRNDYIEGSLVYNNVIVHANYDGTDYHYVTLSSGVDATQSNNYTTTNINDPDFVDAANDDYDLQSTSPLIDAGYDLSSYGIIFDYDGVSRPASSFDIGAFEY